MEPLYVGEQTKDGTNMMHDAHVSAAILVEALGWTLGFALVILDIVTAWDLGELGLLFAGAAGVMQIKGYVRDQRHREQNAFKLGAQAAPVSRLRR